MSKLNSKLYKNKMTDSSSKKSLDDIPGYFETKVEINPGGNIKEKLSAGENGNYQIKKKRSTLGFFKGSCSGK